MTNEPLTPQELDDLISAVNTAEFRASGATWDALVARPDAARELIALEKDGDGDEPPIILDEMARRGGGVR